MGLRQCLQHHCDPGFGDNTTLNSDCDNYYKLEGVVKSAVCINNILSAVEPAEAALRFRCARSSLHTPQESAVRFFDIQSRLHQHFALGNIGGSLALTTYPTPGNAAWLGCCLRGVGLAAFLARTRSRLKPPNQRRSLATEARGIERIWPAVWRNI